MARRDPVITEIDRRVANMVMIGTVSKVDHEKHRYRVKSGELESDWIPFAATRSKGTRVYESLEEGEQVVMVSPSGDTAQAVIMGTVSKEADQAGTKGNEHRTIYPDGTVVEFDHDAKSFRIAVASGGSFALSIGGGVSLVANGGELTIEAPGGIALNSATLTHNGVDISDQHRHRDVMPGGGLTGTPV